VVVVPLDLDNLRSDTAIHTDVSINGKETRALLDTGAPTTSLTLRAARRAGIEESALTPDGRVGGAGEGRVRSWTGRVGTFEIGGEKISNNRLQINDVELADAGLLLGLDYFLSHRLYVSRLQRRIYITWNGGPVFALGHEKPGHYDSRYAALPRDVAQDDADALARRGAAAIAAGKHPQALEDLNRACELAPGVAENFFARARLHLAMHQPRPALADLDAALKLDPALADARLRRAGVRAALGDRLGAQADLAQLDAALPPSSALRADMAELHAGFPQVAEALHQFDLWVTSHPKDMRLASVLNSRCRLRTRLAIDLPLALQDCLKAVDLDEGAAAIGDSLGWTYLRIGDAAKAKKAFDGAIKLEARAPSLYGRALAQQRLNDPDGAERDLAAARKLQPLIEDELRKQGLPTTDNVPPPAVAGS
jgi:tetratricopeptide (TPR) repeat protein